MLIATRFAIREDNGVNLAKPQGWERSLSLTVTAHSEDGFVVLDLKGSLTLGPALSGIREAAKRALSNGKVAGVAVMVGDVTVTDSCGLGELTVIYILTSKVGCPVRLVAPSTNLLKMLKMTRIDELLPSSATLVEAKTAMKRHSKTA